MHCSGAWVLAYYWHFMAYQLQVTEIPHPLLGSSPFHPQATIFVSCYSPDTRAWKFCGLPFPNFQFYRCHLNTLAYDKREIPKIIVFLSCIQTRKVYVKFVSEGNLNSTPKVFCAVPPRCQLYVQPYGTCTAHLHVPRGGSTAHARSIPYIVTLQSTRSDNFIFSMI